MTGAPYKLLECAMSRPPIMYLYILLFLCTFQTPTRAQTVRFELKTNPSVDFVFNTIEKYRQGIIIHDAVVLDIVAENTQWDLYVGSSTGVAGSWDNIQYYSSAGNGAPPISLLQIEFRNSSRTAKIAGFMPMQDLATTTLDIIGDHQASPDPTVSCSDLSPKGTNTAGTYVSDPQCYRFKVDFRITPGFAYRAGLYAAEVDIIIAPDL